MTTILSARAKMRYLACLGLLVFAKPAQAAGPKGVEPALQIVLGPDSNICGLTLPAGFSSQGLNPGHSLKASHKRGLIVWLHGGMRSSNRSKGAEAHRALLPFLNPSQYFLCSPSAFGGQDWLSAPGQEHIDALITYMIGHYPIDVKDINLVGVSDGTLGVLAYSLQGKRELNRHVLISCFPQIVVPPENLAGHRELTTGTWNFLQGGRDRLFPADQVIPYLKHWETVYPNMHLHYFPEGEHDFSFFSSHASDLLKGLFIAGKHVPPG